MRSWMIELRKQAGFTLKDMAKRCGCSVRLLEYLEIEDSKTLPSLARSIGIAYGMTMIQANELAKPLQTSYAFTGAKNTMAFAWTPPKEETKPLIGQRPERERRAPLPVAAPKTPPGLSYNAVISRLQATGKSARQLSLEAGRSENYMGSLILKIRYRLPMSVAAREAVAGLLKCSVRDLEGEGKDDVKDLP